MTSFRITISIAAIAVATSVMAHEGDHQIPIVELTDADLASIDLQDGSIDDWLEIVGEPTLRASEFGSRGSFPYDLDDLDFRIWLAWHGDRIYVGMQQVDDVYLNEFARRTTALEDAAYHIMSTHDSSINLYVDGDHSGGTYRSINTGSTMRTAQLYTAIGETHDDGPHVQIWPISAQPGYFTQDWYLKPPYADGGGAAFSGSPTISVTEFYVTPFDLLVWNSEAASEVSKLAPGRVVGLAISVRDSDESTKVGSPPHGFFRMPDISFGQSADFFADGLLLGPVVRTADGTVVESATWAGIKAFFRGTGARRGTCGIIRKQIHSSHAVTQY